MRQPPTPIARSYSFFPIVNRLAPHTATSAWVLPFYLNIGCKSQ